MKNAIIVTGDGTVKGLLARIGGTMTANAFDLVLKKLGIDVSDMKYFFFSIWSSVPVDGLNFVGYQFFVVFVEGLIHEFQYPQNANFLYEL